MDPAHFLAASTLNRSNGRGDSPETVDAFYDEMGGLPRLWLRLFSGARSRSDAPTDPRAASRPVTAARAAVRLRPELG